MAFKNDHEPSIPAAAQPAYDPIVTLTDTFCRGNLNAEYAALCHKLAGVLARSRFAWDYVYP